MLSFSPTFLVIFTPSPSANFPPLALKLISYVVSSESLTQVILMLSRYKAPLLDLKPIYAVSLSLDKSIVVVPFIALLRSVPADVVL